MREESQFVFEWKQFIENLGKAAERKLNRPEVKIGNKQDLLNLFRDVTKELLSNGNLNEMRQAIALENQLIVNFYRRELKYFNDWVKNHTAENVEDDNDELDTGETVKGSVDKLISKLPGPLQKLIHLLNELLKLVLLAV